MVRYFYINVREDNSRSTLAVKDVTLVFPDERYIGVLTMDRALLAQARRTRLPGVQVTRPSGWPGPAEVGQPRRQPA